MSPETTIGPVDPDARAALGLGEEEFKPAVKPKKKKAKAKKAKGK